MKTELTISIIISFLFPNLSIAQGKMLTIEDVVLKQRTTLAPERLMQLQWITGTEVYSYVVKVNGKEKIIQTNAINQQSDTLFGIEDFQTLFQTLEIDVILPQRLPFITWLNVNEFQFFYNNAYYSMNIKSKNAYIITKLPKDAEDIHFENNTKRSAFTTNNNVFVYEKDTWLKVAENNAAQQISDGVINKDLMVTTDGNYALVNGKSVHRNEFGITKGLFWSNKGNKLAYYKMNESSVTDYELMKFDTKPGTFEKVKYPMAGGNSHLVKLFIKDFEKNRLYEVETKATPEQYLTNVSWSPQENLIYIAVVNRAQNEMRLNEYDGRSGTFIKTLFIEKDEKFVEPEHPMVFVKNDDSKFIWMSKRDGYNQLYLYAQNGKLIRQLTQNQYDVTELLGFDNNGKIAFYLAATNNGLDRQFFSVDLETGKNKLITLTSGVHSVSVSESGNFFLDTYSNIATPRKSILIDKNGAELNVMLNAVNPLNEFVKCEARIGAIAAADKKTILNYRIFYPANFDSSLKYPSLIYVYGGPHAQMITNSWLAGADMWLYHMAQQGYFVFTIDNRGSANRGKEFEQATFRNLGIMERLDQLEGISFLKANKYIDTTRMGIFGWSFGGFMTINMMSKTKEFKVGVAGGPVIDWSLYEIMYTERYMDKPLENLVGYKESTLTNYVKDLQGKLLIIHGTDDDVVLWQHSLTYVKKCIEEGVQLDYFVYPDHKHNVIGKDRVHLMKKVTDYFKLHL